MTQSYKGIILQELSMGIISIPGIRTLKNILGLPAPGMMLKNRSKALDMIIEAGDISKDIEENKRPELDSILWKIVHDSAYANGIYMKEYDFQIMMKSGINPPMMLIYTILMVKLGIDAERSTSPLLFHTLNEKVVIETGFYRQENLRQKNQKPHKRDIRLRIDAEYVKPENHDLALMINTYMISMTKLPASIEIQIPGKKISDIVKSDCIPDAYIESVRSSEKFSAFNLDTKDERFQNKPLHKLVKKYGFYDKNAKTVSRMQKG